jgi:hypothetical protein
LFLLCLAMFLPKKSQTPFSTGSGNNNQNRI